MIHPMRVVALIIVVATLAGVAPTFGLERGRFVYASAFSILPPDSTSWEPPPGGMLEDGVFTAKFAPSGTRLALTMDVIFSPVMLDETPWREPQAARDYHERLLSEERLAHGKATPNRRLGSSAAELDLRFGLPAVWREVVVEEISATTGAVTDMLTERSWRFRHPQSPILEFVAEVRFRSSPGAAAVPPLTGAELAFLSSLVALPLDRAPDIAIPLGSDRLDAVALGHGSLWVTDLDDNTLTRIDLTTKRPVATVTVGAGPHALEITDDSVWVANHNDNSVMRIDARENRIAATSTVPSGPHQLLDHRTGLWLVCDAGCVLTKIDKRTAKPVGDALSLGTTKRSRTGRREKLWQVMGRKAGACTDMSLSITGAGNELLISERFRGAIARLDSSGSLSRLDVGVEVGPLVFDGSNIWGLDDLTKEGVLHRIDPATGRALASLDLGPVAGGLEYGGGVIWVTRERQDSVLRIDPSTNRMVGHPIPVDSPAAMVAGPDGVWIAGGGAVVRIPY